MTDVSNQRYSMDAPPAGGSTTRIAIRVGIAAALLIAGGAIALLGERLLGGSSAPTNEVHITPFQDWRVVCSQAGGCALSSEVQRDTGGTLVTLTVSDPTAGSNLIVTVPHGIMLEPGLGFSIGTEPMKVRQFETCNANGCIAFVALDADTLKSLSANMNGQVVVVPGNGTPVTIPVSLKGFADGFAELQRNKARRGSFFSFLSS